MITGLYCSFRRNSHTPCLHPVIHLELPFPSLYCFPSGDRAGPTATSVCLGCTQQSLSSGGWVTSRCFSVVLPSQSTGNVRQTWGSILLFLPITSLPFYLTLCCLLNNLRHCLRCMNTPSVQTHIFPNILYLSICFSECNENTKYKTR